MSTKTDEIKKAAEPEISPEEIEAQKEAWRNRKVIIKLFKDDGAYKDDVVVGINGKLWNIPRGVQVEVPLPVAEIIKNMDKQDTSTARLVSQMEAEYEKKNK